MEQRGKAEIVQKPWPLGRLISGGQTGVDRLALDTARSLGIAVGGWCPKGRRAEDGTIPPDYELREAQSELYQERTRLNVRDSDATLILCRGAPQGGTLLTLDLARGLKRPCLLLDLLQAADADLIAAGRTWLWNLQPVTLNVAGPRAGELGVEAERVKLILAACLTAGVDPPPEWPPRRPHTPDLSF